MEASRALTTHIFHVIRPWGYEDAIHMVNLKSTLEKMADELTCRLTDSALRNWIGQLSIGADDQLVVLNITLREVPVGHEKAASNGIEGGQEIIRLLIGTAEPDEVIESARLRCSGEPAKFARILFAAQNPVMPNEDL